MERTKMFGVVRLLAVMLMGVATVTAAEPKQPMAAATMAFDKITYKDSGGFSGRGSGKSLLLTGDGNLEVKSFAGQAKPVQLEKPELEGIHKTVAAVDWKTIQKSYLGQGADMYQNDLTIVIAGKTHETHANANAKLPPELRKLFAQLDTTYRRATAKK